MLSTFRTSRRLPLITAAMMAFTPVLSVAASVPAVPPRLTTVTPDPAIATNTYTGTEPNLSPAALTSLLHADIRYVFVLYQENRSYDSLFGTFPGADGIYSSGLNANGTPIPRPVAQTPGYYEQIEDVNGNPVLVHPFRITPGPRPYVSSPADAPMSPVMYSPDTDDLDHSHDGLLIAEDLVNGVPRMDKFAAREQANNAASLGALGGKQFGELAMAYEDGDTVPFLWQYANRFTLFDHIFQQTTGPSTPGNLSIFGAQAGITQAVLGVRNNPLLPGFASTVFNGQPLAAGQTKTNQQYTGAPASATTYLLDSVYTEVGSLDGNSGPALPLLNDSNPLWGSNYDGVTAGSANKQPYGAGTKVLVGPNGRSPDNQAGNPSLNMTYATIALTLGGSQITSLLGSDPSPATDLDDVQYKTPDTGTSDENFIQATSPNSFAWGWYESGYGAETTPTGQTLIIPAGANAGDPVTSSGLHASYIAHHDGPQYFGYIANNPQEYKNIHPLSQFFSDLGTAPNSTPSLVPGLYYVKGGYQNILNLHPADPNAKVQTNFIGDDDHPAYSDSQISEAQVATDVNAIAASPYWNHCAIIITWDDSEGDYDHVQPPVRSVGPDGAVLSDGPRVPLLVISPFAKTHAVLSDSGDHSSVVKFADRVFGLTPLADLPAENYARKIARTMFGIVNAGPNDDQTADISDLSSAFDPARLQGTAPLLPPSYATIPTATVLTVPLNTANGTQYGLQQIGVLPTDYALGIPNAIPPDFNPRPSTLPSTTTGGVTTYIQP